MRRHELNDQKISSIYLGGGTPSILNENLLLKLFDAVSNAFSFDASSEITLEANPDDVTQDKLLSIKKTPVNRFSMGVQSFFDEDLKWMNRAHNASESEKSIKLIQDAGFDKISIDLIYGGPTLTNDHWEKNLEKVNSLKLNHVSAYCLTVEPNTALQHQINKGSIVSPDDDKAAVQFDMLVDYLESSNFEQYEISNFARNGEYAKHNTSYWQNKPYIGVGPSAHSFNGTERRWNIANNQLYIKGIASGIIQYEKEFLTLENRINEYLMTGLRTIWGCDENFIRNSFGEEMLFEVLQKLYPYLNSEKIEKTASGFRLTRKARILADGIASELFF